MKQLVLRLTSLYSDEYDALPNYETNKAKLKPQPPKVRDAVGGKCRTFSQLVEAIESSPDSFDIP